MKKQANELQTAPLRSSVEKGKEENGGYLMVEKYFFMLRRLFVALCIEAERERSIMQKK